MFRFSSFNGLLLYKHSIEDGKLQHIMRVPLDHPIVDYEFIGEDIVILLATKDGDSSVVSMDTRGVICSDGFGEKKFMTEFFSGIGDTFKEQNLDSYYKRWYDNVNAYHETKEKRMNTDKRTAAPDDLENNGGSRTPKRPCPESARGGDVTPPMHRD